MDSWSPEDDLDKDAAVESTELRTGFTTEQPENDPSWHDTSGDALQLESNGENGLSIYDQHDTTIRRSVSRDQSPELPDAEYYAHFVDPDMVSGEDLNGHTLAKSPLLPKKAAFSGHLDTVRDSRAVNGQRHPKSEDVTSPAAQSGQHIKIPPARRIFSTDTTATDLGATDLGAGRRILSAHTALKSLPFKERLVKAHQCLKELQYTCGLPTDRERVTLQHVYALIDKIRIRKVPHEWGAVDRRLKQVQSSAERMADFVALVSKHGQDAQGVGSMFFACCEQSLQGGQAPESLCLDDLASIFYRVGAILQHVKLSAREGVSSQRLQTAFVKMTQVLQRLCVAFVEMLDELKARGASLSSAVFGRQMYKYSEADMASLAAAASEVCQELWLQALSGVNDPDLESCHGHVLDWLDDHPHHHRHDDRFHGYEYGETFPFVFDCVEPIVSKFFKTSSRLLLVTGDSGYGEEEMLANLIGRLQLALPVDARLLRTSFGKIFMGTFCHFSWTNYSQHLLLVPHGA
jgi:hypothetical protein